MRPSPPFSTSSSLSAAFSSPTSCTVRSARRHASIFDIFPTQLSYGRDGNLIWTRRQVKLYPLWRFPETWEKTQVVVVKESRMLLLLVHCLASWCVLRRV